MNIFGIMKWEVVEAEADLIQKKTGNQKKTKKIKRKKIIADVQEVIHLIPLTAGWYIFIYIYIFN